MTIMTNVHKIKLDEIAIPGQEGGFKSNIYAIVDIDNHKIFRAIPERKEFFSNQRIVADFEQSADNLNYDIGDIREEIYFNGGQMVRVYEAINSMRGYKIRHFLYNAYNKSNGHILYTALIKPESLAGINRQVYFPTPIWGKVVMTDLSQEEVQSVLVNIHNAIERQTHHLTWLREQTNRQASSALLTNYLSIITESQQQNIIWRIDRNTRATAYDSLALANFYLLNTTSLLNTDSSPREISRQKRFNKYLEADTPPILLDGYTYEEPTTNTDEQDATGDGVTNNADADVGDPNALGGDVPPTGTTFDVAY